MRAVAVIRVSTDHQADSPRVQMAAMEEWARRHQHEIVAVYQEIAISGGLDYEERPILHEAMAALDRLEADTLLFSDRTRLARDHLTAALVERDLRKRNKRVCVASGVSASDDPSSQLVATILDAVAQHERVIIKNRIKAAMAQKKLRGELVGAVPYGKSLGPDGKTLQPHPQEQEVIALVKRLAGEGESTRGIARRLDQLGLKPRSGKAWHKTQIARLLQA